MKILVIGNSQTVILNQLIERSNLFENFSYLSIPGTWGPNFDLVGANLLPNKTVNELGWTPYAYNCDVDQVSIDDYDTIVVTNIAAYDSGLPFISHFFQQGLMSSAQPTTMANSLSFPHNVPLGDEVFSCMFVNNLQSLPGINLCIDLRNSFSGRILLMENPSVLSYCYENPAWTPHKYYNDSLYFKNKCEKIKKEFLIDFADRLGFELLLQPVETLDFKGFTNDLYDREIHDGFHVNHQYGDVVSKQLINYLFQI